MSKQIEDGGPAFPLPRKYTEPGNDIAYHEDFGMTLRDYFAAKAMEGILAGKAGNMDLWESETAVMTAQHAYERADAMLRARKAGAQ